MIPSACAATPGSRLRRIGSSGCPARASPPPSRSPSRAAPSRHASPISAASAARPTTRGRPRRTALPTRRRRRTRPPRRRRTPTPATAARRRATPASARAPVRTRSASTSTRTPTREGPGSPPAAAPSRPPTATTFAAGPALPTSGFAHVALDVTLDKTNGAVKLAVDGAVRVDVANVQTDSTATVTARHVAVGAYSYHDRRRASHVSTTCWPTSRRDARAAHRRHSFGRLT